MGMPSYFPENNTPLPQDNGEKSLQKINDLLVDGISVVVGELEIKNDSGNPLWVTDGGSSLTVDGTVTATVRQGEDAIINDPASGYTTIRAQSHWFSDSDNEVKVTSENNPLPISGTVTANGGTEIGTTGNPSGIIALGVDDVGSANPLTLDGNGNLAISGTVTANSASGTVTNRSSTISTGGTSQQVAASNSNRKYFLIQNISDTDMYVGVGYTPTTTTGILLAKNGGGVSFESNYIPTSQINILCATTGKAFAALEG
jgi:hypothetical protein